MPRPRQLQLPLVELVVVVDWRVVDVFAQTGAVAVGEVVQEPLQMELAQCPLL